jgi:hypothetical protein
MLSVIPYYVIGYFLSSVFCPLSSNLRLAVCPRQRVASLHAPCPMPFAFRMPKTGTRPQGGSPKDKS